MMTPKHAASLAVLCAASLTATAVSAAPASVKVPVPRVVDKPQAARLYHRILSAAQEVCEPLDSRELARKRAYNRCVDEAVTNAVAQVNARELTSILLARHGDGGHLRL
jgi:UrcA family protein